MNNILSARAEKLIYGMKKKLAFVNQKTNIKKMEKTLIYKATLRNFKAIYSYVKWNKE